MAIRSQGLNSKCKQICLGGIFSSKILHLVTTFLRNEMSKNIMQQTLDKKHIKSKHKRYPLLGKKLCVPISIVAHS